MFFFLNLVHLRPCRTDLLVTCLPLQSAMIGDTLGDFVSSLQIILLNYIQVIPDYCIHLLIAVIFRNFGVSLKR